MKPTNSHKIFIASLLIYQVTVYSIRFYFLPVEAVIIAILSFIFFWMVIKDYLLEGGFKNREHFWYVPVYPVLERPQHQRLKEDK